MLGKHFHEADFVASHGREVRPEFAKGFGNERSEQRGLFTMIDRASKSVIKHVALYPLSTITPPGTPLCK